MLTVSDKTIWLGKLFQLLRSTDTRWHLAFRLCCHSNETRDKLQILPKVHN